MGTVTGPTSSTNNALARWNGTTGTVIEDSTVTLDGSGNLSGVVSLAGSVTTTTQSQGDNSTKLATTAYVDTGLSNLSLDSLSDVVTDYSSAAMYLGQGSGGTGTQAQNTALGYNALASLTSMLTAQGNTAVGQQTLFSNISGQLNVAVGEQAMQSRTSGNYNVAVGMSCFFAQISGAQNVGIGYNVGATSTTGSNNILIGYQADVPTASTSNHLNIGGAITGDLSSGNITIAGTIGATNLSGTNTGDQTITLTGDVTGSGTGSFATTIKSSVALAGNPTTTTQSAGDNSTKIATTAYADAAASAVGITTGTALSLSPFAATQTVTQAHGLGATPDYLKYELICLTANNGYTAGQVLNLLDVTGTSGDSAFSTHYDSTNVVVVTNSSAAIQVQNPSTHLRANITYADWALKITPYKF